MNRRLGWGHLCAGIAAGALLWSVALVAGPLAEAAPVSSQKTGWLQPYGGCDEAWQAPRSAGARECRAHGWTIKPRLVVGPRGVVRYNALPVCRNEDGSGQRSGCTWNLDSRDLEYTGRAYWLDSDDRTHYVWPRTPHPIRAGWAHWSTASDRATWGIGKRCWVDPVERGSVRVDCPGWGA